MQNEQQNQPNHNPTNPAARRNARRFALQALYEWHMSGNAIRDIENDFLLNRIDKKCDMDYFKELLHELPKCVDEVDEEIKPFLNRSMKDIDPVELTTVRLATYELLKRLDVPGRVVLNEALELCKEFGSVEGFKFVNGVLDKIAKKIRTTELGQG